MCLWRPKDDSGNHSGLFFHLIAFLGGFQTPPSRAGIDTAAISAEQFFREAKALTTEPLTQLLIPMIFLKYLSLQILLEKSITFGYSHISCNSNKAGFKNILL